MKHNSLFFIDFLTGDVWISGEKYEDPKQIKNALLALACLIVLAGIASVIIHRKMPYEFQQDRAAITSIEIVQTRYDVSFDSGQNEGPAEFDDLLCVSVIDPAHWNAFFNKYSQITCRGASRDNLYFEGRLIRITYADGAWELIDEGSMVYCLPDGRITFPQYTLDADGFSELTTLYAEPIKVK